MTDSATGAAVTAPGVGAESTEVGGAQRVGQLEMPHTGGASHRGPAPTLQPKVRAVGFGPPRSVPMTRAGGRWNVAASAPSPLR